MSQTNLEVVRDQYAATNERDFGDWISTFDQLPRFDVKEMSELEDGAVLVMVDYNARGRLSGAEVRGNVLWLYRVRGEKITHVEGYESRDAALKAAAPGR